MSTKCYLTADEAAAALGISKATLYSYVSRGFLRSEETSGKTRTRRYRAEDVATLKQRQEQRRNPAQAAATALHFGDPVLESAITLIADGQCYYRGYAVVELARRQRFEEVALLLWTGELPDQPFLLEPVKTSQSGLLTAGQSTPAELFQMALLQAASTDLTAYHSAAPSVMRTGRRILSLLTQVVTGPGVQQRIAERLQQAWRPAEPDVVTLLDSALILCADHELNISSFTARCVASAGSTPYAAVVAALAALQGHKHGGIGERVSAFLDQAATDPQRAVRDCLRRGEPLPGFGHQLYPAGDPRSRLLLELAHDARPTAPILAVADAVVETAGQAIQLAPNLDFGLAVLTRALALPVYAPFTLFALGRTAGWIGHIIEQYGLNQLIRPRSHYVGVQPHP
ncbi:MAG: helix-turn-helix domain-containing protein [Caldilinea sp. CFX5]|nr:helix-turn-helix domain-containing protein [Caldilinea sp. CFX5]